MENTKLHCCFLTEDLQCTNSGVPEKPDNNPTPSVTQYSKHTSEYSSYMTQTAAKSGKDFGGFMWIIFKNLPRGITTREINKVTLKGYKPRLWLARFLNKNVIKRSKIILIKDPKTCIPEYHAIVQIDSPAIAESIIKNLDGKTLNGILLKPHRYYRRFPAKDKRMQAAGHTDQQERRKDDRRRPGLVTQVLEIS